MNRHASDDQPPAAAVPSSDALIDAPSSLRVLSTLDPTRLRRLALRYHIRSDGTLRPVADVAYDLRSLHGVELSTRQVFELLSRKAGRGLLSSLARH
jgi:hypothetical protein